ncbi:MAG: HlyD family efflux transporter periplasmic adaptor subunit [Bacillota bacterium]|nr:HlyD family efflux transporter periplasmic adaptor subunit [Bacillota bacterium]
MKRKQAGKQASKPAEISKPVRQQPFRQEQHSFRQEQQRYQAGAQQGNHPDADTSPRKLRSEERLAQIERRKARNRAFSLTILVLLIMVVTVFAIILVMRQAKPRPRFLFIQNGTLAHNITLSGLISRDEQLFNAPTDGLLKPLATEGSRAAKGQKLAMIIPEGKEAELRDLQKCEKDIVDLQIELMQQGKGAGARAIYDESAASLDSVISLVRSDLTRNDYDNISAYQTALTIILEQRTARLMTIDFQDARLTALKQTQAALEQALGIQAATLVCQKPGIVSYKLDGMESDLTNAAVLTLPSDTIRQMIDGSQSVLSVNQKTEKDKPVLRVSSSLYQSLSFIIPGNQTAVYPVDSLHTLTIADGGLAIESCQVVRAEKTGTDTLVVFRTDRRLEWLSDRRTVRTELTLSATTGLKVPYVALFEHDTELGQASMMIVVYGVARSCKVQVVDYDREHAIIRAIETETYQPDVSTILVVNPASIEAGEFIGN